MDADLVELGALQKNPLGELCEASALPAFWVFIAEGAEKGCAEITENESRF